MKILYVGSEVIPFISTGGLGDVLGSLPAAIAKNSAENDVRVVMPYFKSIKEKFGPQLTFVGETVVHLSWRNQYCGVYSYEKDGVTYYDTVSWWVYADEYVDGNVNWLTATLDERRVDK